jgi:hypothetical protein
MMLLAAMATGEGEALRQIDVATAEGTRAAARYVRVSDFSGASAGQARIGSVVVYDAHTRLYWYTHFRSSLPLTLELLEKTELPPFRFATDGTSLAGFRIAAEVLHARRSQAHAASLEEAKQLASAAIERELKTGWPSEPKPAPSPYQEIELSAALGEAFVKAGRPIGGPDSVFAISIADVAIERGLWRIDVRNRKGDLATLFLTPDLKLTDDSTAARGRREKE